MRSRLAFIQSMFTLLSFLLCTSFVSIVCAYSIEYDSRWEYRSQSMLPTVELFDFVYVKNVTGQADVHASYTDGDIILFQSPQVPGEFIIHRAVEKFQQNSAWYFKAKGDHNAVIDTWNIPEDYVIGKVVALSRVLQENSYNVTVFSNSAFSNFHFNSTINALEFNVTALLTQSAPNSFLNVTLPNELVTGELDVLVDGSLAYFEHSTNATHHFIWFDWERTNYTCNVVLPEFPSFLVPSLFMIATVLAVIVYRRKKGEREAHLRFLNSFTPSTSVT